MAFSSSQVSVVVPTYNRAEVVGRALRSIAGQTTLPGEVVVIDDGSTDDTRERIASGFPAVRYHKIPRSGVSAARNLGIAMSRGEWIAFLDSDDEWQPAKLERQIAALIREPGHVLCHTDEIWIRRGRQVNPRLRHKKYGGRIFERCLPLCSISPSSALIHRSIFTEIGTFDESLPACEDYDLWLRVCAHHPVLLVAEPLVRKHGGHADQLSQRYPGMDRFRIQALEKVVARREELGLEDLRATLEVLLAKIDIYRNGATRRGRGVEAETYGRKRDTYEALLRKACAELGHG